MSNISIKEIYRLSQQHKKVSRLDLFALQLAREKEAILLTDDKNLCKVAAGYKVECPGTIWLIERMVRCQIIQSEVALNAYEKMQQNGSRLPWKDAYQRLKEITNIDLSNH